MLFLPLSCHPIRILCHSCSYPIGQLPQGVDRQNEAKEGDWPAVPRGRVTDTITERTQTVTESQSRYTEPDHEI